MTALDQILRLRAMREDRAARALALAEAQRDAAQAAHAQATAEIASHDATTAERESRLHDAMIAQGFTLADLRDADDRALNASGVRDGLTAASRAAEDAATKAQTLANDRLHALRHAARRHEKLRLAVPQAPADDEDPADHD